MSGFVDRLEAAQAGAIEAETPFGKALVDREAGIEKCCQRPMRSVTSRSTRRMSLSEMIAVRRRGSPSVCTSAVTAAGRRGGRCQVADCKAASPRRHPELPARGGGLAGALMLGAARRELQPPTPPTSGPRLAEG